jgi:hypothetical protein
MKQGTEEFWKWWNDQDNGCPTLVLDNDEEFAIAVWNAATIFSAGICDQIGNEHQKVYGSYSAGKKAGAFECRDTILNKN